jgi:hypothetical protein
MGADLYIEKMDEDAQYTGFGVPDKARNLGYFRDCYNEGGLFAWLTRNTGYEYSWWGFRETNKDCFNTEGNLKVSGLDTFMSYVLKAKGKVDGIDRSFGPRGEKLGKKNHEFYVNWYNGLIEFVELAKKKKSKIIFRG